MGDLREALQNSRRAGFGVREMAKLIVRCTANEILPSPVAI